jgi:hypothetical protein
VQAGQAAEPSSTSPLRSRVLQSIARVSQGLLERETEVSSNRGRHQRSVVLMCCFFMLLQVRLLLLAALCGEHLLLLGPPGESPAP